MQVKWKIFLAFNFILALPALACFFFLLIDFLNHDYSGEDLVYLFLFLLGLFMMPVNCFLNIYTVQRFFPDKLIPLATRRLSIASLVLTSFVAIGILVVCIYGASIEFNQDRPNRDNSGRIALLILTTCLIMQIIVLVMQAQLPGLITRNNRDRMHSLIDSIGE